MRRMSDKGVSEEFKARVEELRKKLEPEFKGNNDLYKLVEWLVEEDLALEETLKKMPEYVRKVNFSKELPIVYQEDGDIVYEYADGTIKKKKDLPEDDWLYKRYDGRLNLP